MSVRTFKPKKEKKEGIVGTFLVLTHSTDKVDHKIEFNVQLKAMIGKSLCRCQSCAPELRLPAYLKISFVVGCV
jgi:hypothetical protein